MFFHAPFRWHTVLAAAIGHAQQRVWITQAYFAPDDTFTEIIETAARRGVDVRLLLPAVSDAPLVIQASRSSYEDLLEAGVRIYERTSSTLHAKTVVVDGVWTSIGSTNYDYRSFVHNYELNAVIVSRDFGRAMEKLYHVDLLEADEITLHRWRQRPLIQRLKEGLGRILRLGSGCKSIPKAVVADEHQIRSVLHFRVCYEPVESQIGMQGTFDSVPPMSVFTGISIVCQQASASGELAIILAISSHPSAENCQWFCPGQTIRTAASHD